jgi:hypothetical protein
VSGVTTSARVTKTDRVFGEWGAGHPIRRTIVAFKYEDVSGKSYEGWEKVSGFSASISIQAMSFLSGMIVRVQIVF